MGPCKRWIAAVELHHQSVPSFDGLPGSSIRQATTHTRAAASSQRQNSSKTSRSSRDFFSWNQHLQFRSVKTYTFWSQESPAVAIRLQPQPSLTEVHGKPGSRQVAWHEASAAYWLQMAAWNEDWNGLIEITYGSLLRIEWSEVRCKSLHLILLWLCGHATYRIPACFKRKTNMPRVALRWEMRQEGHTTKAAKSWQKPGEVGNLNHIGEMLQLLKLASLKSVLVK